MSTVRAWRRASGGSAPSGATWDATNKNANVTLSADKLTASGGTNLQNQSVMASLAITAGKIWVEVSVLTATGGTPGIGICPPGFPATSDTWIGSFDASIGYYVDTNVYQNTAAVATYGPYGAGDIINMAVDVSGGTIQWYKNDIALGTPISHGLGATLYPVATISNSAGGTSIRLAVAGSFINAPPSGFAEYGA